MGKPPRSPHPPDTEGDVETAPGVVNLGDLKDVVVEGADWANQRASRLAMVRVEVRLCRLTGAELAEAKISDATFVDCQLTLAGLRYAQLERVVFRDCRMSECDFHAASLTDVLFERCDLREASFAGAKVDRAELRGCELAGLVGIDALRTVRMPWNDVLANAPLFALAAGIEIVD